jgi:hypothetical protein
MHMAIDQARHQRAAVAVDAARGIGTDRAIRNLRDDAALGAHEAIMVAFRAGTVEHVNVLENE